MKLDFQKILNGVLSATLKTDIGKIAELSKNGEEELTEEQVISNILNMDVDRVKDIKSDSSTESFQDGYKKAKKEVLSDRDKEIKEKFGIESSKMGLDLISEIVDNTSKPSDATTEEAIRRSKTYLDLEAEYKDKVKQLEKEKETAISEIKSDYEGEKLFSKVNKTALDILDELKPVLPNDQKIAKNQLDAFLNKFKDYKFDLQGDRIVTMDEEGKVLKDQHDRTLDFSEIVKDKASNFFEFQKNNGGSGSGNGSDDDEKKTIEVPKDIEGLTNIMNDKSIDANERLRISQEFEKRNQN